jgi:hypothetical protein
VQDIDGTVFERLMPNPLIASLPEPLVLPLDALPSPACIDLNPEIAALN